MRIAVVSWSGRKVGGTETYLERIIPELCNAGHQLAFWYEADAPLENDRIVLPAGMPAWCVSDMGAQPALAALREWQPDVIYCHSLMEPALEAEMLKVAPAVFFAHAYYGTCVSGTKTFKFPVTTPCHRRFGLQCLAHYYPHRCGGLNPITMLKEYKRQSQRLEHLSIYKAIVTHSTYMQTEYLNHGFDPERVHCLSYYSNTNQREAHAFPATVPSEENPHIGGGPLELEAPPFWQLLFLGRMDSLKGGSVLIDAMPRVSAALERPLRLTFAGEGLARDSWERHAARVQKKTEGLEIEFVGWVKGQAREVLWNQSHLMVLPSLWPEPFGLVGIESGLRGVPTAAFAVGGVTDWLRDGVNGYLASGEPPTSENLADAIIKCLRDPEEYARLRRRALEVAQDFKMETHRNSLLRVLEKVSQERLAETS